MDEQIRITNGTLSAVIDRRGAELWSLTDVDGHELMTNADPTYWGWHAPLLFPVVGAPAGDTIRVDGQAYRMPKHGFARRSDFALVETGPARAVFALSDDAMTRAVYPFAFRLELAYELRGATLAIEATVINPADETLYASFGFHPAFAWPLPFGRARADHRIVFADDEPGLLRTLAEDGTIAAEDGASPLQGRTLHLTDALFDDPKDALVWSPVHSQSVRYGAPEGPQLEIAFPDTPMLGIWTKPGSAYICVEPWHGIADPHGYDGEFRDKPGVFAVAPHGEKRITMSVTLIGDQVQD